VGVGCTSLGAVVNPGHMLSSSSVCCQAPPWAVTYAVYPCFSLVAAAAARAGSIQIRVIGCLYKHPASRHAPKHSMSKHAPLGPTFMALYFSGGLAAAMMPVIRIVGYQARAPAKAALMGPGILLKICWVTGISVSPE
jgi:hypothetical protein